METLRSRLGRDLAALGLLGVVIFLGAALWSYDPADPPGTVVFPSHASPANWCGRAGAWVSWALLETLGIGAYYLLVSLASLDLALLARRTISEPVLRFAGWLVSLVGLSTLAAMAWPVWPTGPVIGPGGYLGATFHSLLVGHFGRVGSVILAISFLVGGLLLATERFMLWVLRWTVVAPARGLWQGALRVLGAYAERLSGPPAGSRTSRTSSTKPASDQPGVRIKRPASSPEVRVFSDAPPLPGAETTAEAAAVDRAAKDPTAPPSGSGAAGASEPRIRKPQKPSREEWLQEIEAASRASENTTPYELPSLDLLLESEPFQFELQEKEVRQRAQVIEKTFADFGYHVRVVEIQTGPVLAQYEVALEAGLRLSKIASLADDLAIALRVPSVRIVAPIPGKNTVGIEVPNSERQIVRLREVMEETLPMAQRMRIPIFLGKDVAGNPMVVDLTTLPHLLIAGRTGTGKSVCLNSIIMSIVMTRRPDEVRMLLIDPKMVELTPYQRLPHLMHPVVTDMRKAEAILGWAVEKMEERYHLLARAGVRHISVYNQLGLEEILERIQPASDEERSQIPAHLPYIVIIADEMADLMMTAAKEVEAHIIRLAQKSRAVGIHLVLATQKPTVDVITGLIKSNLPARISFQVASRTDSRVILDEMGAERLLGNGDMLFLWPGTSTLIRGQGTYVSDEEIARVISAVATDQPDYVHELVELKPSEPGPTGPAGLRARDELYEAAVDIVVREGRGSVSLLQRALGIGYGRAARLIDYMAEDGIVGPYNGSQAREVLISLEEWERMCGRVPLPTGGNPSEPHRPRKPHRIYLGPSPPTDTAPNFYREEYPHSGNVVRLEEESASRSGPFPLSDPHERDNDPLLKGKISSFPEGGKDKAGGNIIPISGSIEKTETSPEKPVEKILPKPKNGENNDDNEM